MLCNFAVHAISDTYPVRNPHSTSKAGNAYRSRPRAFEGYLALSRAPGLYETASLTLHLESFIDEPLRAKIRFVIPQGMFFIGEGGSFLHKPAFFQDIYLPAKSVTQPFVNFTVVKTGNYILQASVYTSSENHSQMPKITPQHFFIYLSVSHIQSTFSNIEYLPLTRFQSRITSVIPDTQRLAPRKADLGIVTVKGTAKYFDDNELRELPIRNLQVTLFDRNRKLPDEKIATTYTNEKGEYDFTVQNIDREDDSKRDLYVIFSFENDTLFIQDRNDRLYEEASETISDFPDEELQFHLLFDLQDSLRGLGAIHNTIMNAHDFLLKKVSWERDAILIQWPATDSFSYYEISSIGFKIFEIINIIRGDEWNHMAMYHEYGHAVMTSAYGNDFDKIPFGEYNGTPHWLFTVSDREFAMSEGWAEFMEAVIEDNALNVTGYVNADTPNIESNKWWTGDVDGNGSNTRGELVEGAVASVFWDIADTALSLDKTPEVDDDGISDMFSELWEIFTNDRPIDIIEVAGAWRKRNFDNYDELELIYTTHSILLRPNSPPDITIISPPAEGAVVDSSYTITWIASDKDNDDFTVDLFFDTNNILGGEIPIKTMIPQKVNSFEWNTSGIPDGRYYISIIARDIRAGENSIYSDGTLIVDHSPLSAPVVTSSSHPEQSRWYANDSPQFILRTTPYSVERQYSYVLNSKPDVIPDTKPEKDIEENSFSFNNLPEGTWWLHIRAQDNLGYWTDATHFRINIDVSKPPKVENVHWVDGKITMDDASSTVVELAWDAADDDISGIAQYHVQIYVNSAGVESPNISADNLSFEGAVDGNILSKSFTLDVEYTYFARVRAEDRAGLLGNWSSISAGFTALRQHPWDVNRDNKVDIEDLVLVEAHFGREKLNASSKDSDVNGDGVIDILDLVLVGKHFGSVILNRKDGNFK